MEFLGLLALAFLLCVVLGILGYAWFQYTSEGGFFGFWMGWNILDTAGHVFTLLLAVLASMFKQD